jgi:CRISPR/Cas system CSM-associated protein Csm3 (group 7 of RAMP superfamily)
MACRIFGSTWHPSGIASSDMRLIKSQQLKPSSLLRAERTSVAISRRLGIAQTGALLFTETTVREIGDKPLCFEGVMQGRLSDEEAGWLLAGARLVTHAGGSKARGLGEMEVKIAKVERWQQEEQRWQMFDANKLIEGALNDGTT